MSNYVSARTEEELEQLYIYMTMIGCKWSSGRELKDRPNWKIGTAFYIPSIKKGSSLLHNSVHYTSSDNMTVPDYLRSVGITDKLTVTIGDTILPDYHEHKQSKETSQIRSNSIAKSALAKLLIEE